MTRSELMSRIKSRSNKSTELAVMALLRKHRITGWRRHTKVLGIRPDFVFDRIKAAVFVDGCFWHLCEDHCHLYRLSKFWQVKILNNRLRDRRQTRLLRRNGWQVLRIWEHDLKGATVI